jgi:hypothetical protein
MNSMPLKEKLQVLCWAVSLALAVLVAVSAQATTWDAVFYELTENMMFDGFARTGSGALAGEAKVGTPLCPEAMMNALLSSGYLASIGPCYVTAYGTDSITIKGSGELKADIAVKVQGDNPVDAPEFVVMTGRLKGGMQVADEQMRLIAIWGTFTVDGQDVSTPFTGMVRLPFINDEQGRHRRPRRGERAFYLKNDGRMERVQKDEESVGWPAARFELTFGAPAPIP